MHKLSDADAFAVDMLLDTSSGSPSDGADGNGAHKGIPPAQFRERLERWENVLGLLREYPALEPPPDLVARTLARVDSHSAPRVSPTPPQQRAATGDAAGTQPD